MNKRFVTYSVSQAEWDELVNYCKEKGFEKPGHLARFSTKRYTTQYPIKNANAGTPQEADGD